MSNTVDAKILRASLDAEGIGGLDFNTLEPDMSTVIPPTKCAGIW